MKRKCRNEAGIKGMAIGMPGSGKPMLKSHAVISLSSVVYLLTSFTSQSLHEFSNPDVNNTPKYLHT
jgi:hypothetical protein